MFFRWSRTADVQGGATMNHLLENFDLVATAPEGIAQLRKLILELAIRGKLVPQDPADESAHILVDRIKNERARLIKKWNIRRDKELPKINPEEEPFLLPSSWKWVRYSDLATFLNGRAYRKDELLTEGTPVLRVGNLFTSEKWYYSNLQLESEKYCEQGDLLYAWSASFGPHIWNGEKCIYHYHIWNVVRYSDGLINRDYLYLCLLEDTERIKKSGHGVMLAHMTKEAIEKRVMPFPPLAEQTRIVTRVQELMAVLDHLEERTNDAEKAREQTLLATTRSLPQLPTPEALAHGWGGFSENLDRLVRRAEDVKALRSMVLELAVRGKLVPQDSNDEPASVLFAKINAEKARLAKAGKIKIEKNHPTLMETDIPYKLPKGWLWARVGALGVSGTGSTPSTSDPECFGSVFPFIRPAQINEMSIEYTGKMLSQKGADNVGIVPENSILMVCIGTIGKCWFVEKPVTCNQQINYISPITGVDIGYLVWAMKAKLFQDQAWAKSSATTIRIINRKKWESLPVPLPPLPEQTRIVARVQELMAVLDRLEERLRVQEKVASRLGEAVVKVG